VRRDAQRGLGGESQQGEVGGGGQWGGVAGMLHWLWESRERVRRRSFFHPQPGSSQLTSTSSSNHQPTNQPTSKPTSQPANQPTNQPATAPSTNPSINPTRVALISSLAAYHPACTTPLLSLAGLSADTITAAEPPAAALDGCSAFCGHAAAALARRLLVAPPAYRDLLGASALGVGRSGDGVDLVRRQYARAANKSMEKVGVCARACVRACARVCCGLSVGGALGRIAGKSKMQLACCDNLLMTCSPPSRQPRKSKMQLACCNNLLMTCSPPSRQPRIIPCPSQPKPTRPPRQPLQPPGLHPFRPLPPTAAPPGPQDCRVRVRPLPQHPRLLGGALAPPLCRPNARGADGRRGCVVDCSGAGPGEPLVG